MTALPTADAILPDQTRTAIVCAAYEVLLGREVDAGGLDTQRKSLRTFDSLEVIVDSILNSDEGRQQHITGDRLAQFLAQVAAMSPAPALAAAVRMVAAKFLFGHALDTDLTALSKSAPAVGSTEAWIGLAHSESEAHTHLRFCAFGCDGQTLVVAGPDDTPLRQIPITQACFYGKVDWPNGGEGARGFSLGVPALGLKHVVRLHDQHFREWVDATLTDKPDSVADIAGFEGSALRFRSERLIDPALSALHAQQTENASEPSIGDKAASEILSWYVNDWAMSQAAPGRLDLTADQVSFLRAPALAPGVLAWPVSQHIFGFARAIGQLTAALTSREGLIEVYARFLISAAYPRLAHTGLVPDEVLGALAAPVEIKGVPLNKFWAFVFSQPNPANGGKGLSLNEMSKQALLQKAAQAFAAALLNGHHTRLLPTDWFRLYKRGLDGSEEAPAILAGGTDPDLSARICARALAVRDSLRQDSLSSLFVKGPEACIADHLPLATIPGNPVTLVSHPGSSGLAKNGHMFRTMLRGAGLAWRGVNVDNMHSTEMSIGDDRRRVNRTVNLFAVNADRFGQAATRLPDFGQSGPVVNIAFFLWETTRAPALHARAAIFANEIWTPTEFVRTIYRELTEDRLKVVNVSKQIDVPKEITPFPLGNLGIPNEAFCFLNIADFDSSITRKNPLAAVRAFRRAFPHDPDVRLILKVRRVMPQHWSNTDGYWTRVEAELTADPRIVLLTGDLPEDDYWGLLSATDAFVTLHRGEGFGYGAAHAMFLGKPVIATDFSGTQDFCRPDTAFLVPGELVPVGPGQMFFPDDLGHWMEADIDEAARQMIAVRDNEGSRVGQVTAAAKDHVTELYGADLFQRRVLGRLEDLTR